MSMLETMKKKAKEIKEKLVQGAVDAELKKTNPPKLKIKKGE